MHLWAAVALYNLLICDTLVSLLQFLEYELEYTNEHGPGSCYGSGVRFTNELSFSAETGRMSPREWLVHHEFKTDFELLSSTSINDLLCQFYYEKLPSHSFPLALFPNILTSYINSPPFNRDINVERDKEFDSSNEMLKLSVTFLDLRKIYASRAVALHDRHTLQNKVWLDINLYFGSFTRQLLRNMNKSSFVSYVDNNDGRKYYCITDPNVSPNLSTRMYEQPGKSECPVHSFELYLSKLNPNVNVFFVQPTSDEEFNRSGCWYSPNAIGVNSHSKKLAQIFTVIGVQLNFRNTSLRHLSKRIQEEFPPDKPSYSDKIFRILTNEN